MSGIDFVEVVKIELPEGVEFRMRRLSMSDGYELAFSRVEVCNLGELRHSISIEVTGNEMAEVGQNGHAELFQRKARDAIRNLGGGEV